MPAGAVVAVADYRLYLGSPDKASRLALAEGALGSGFRVRRTVGPKPSRKLGAFSSRMFLKSFGRFLWRMMLLRVSTVHHDGFSMAGIDSSLQSVIDVFNGFRAQGSGAEFNKLLKPLKS